MVFAALYYQNSHPSTPYLDNVITGGHIFPEAEIVYVAVMAVLEEP
jgi:hypothetical protein